MILKNELEGTLAALSFEDGKSRTIFSAIKQVLNKYDFFSSIKMIITDKNKCKYWKE